MPVRAPTDPTDTASPIPDPEAWALGRGWCLTPRPLPSGHLGAQAAPAASMVAAPLPAAGHPGASDRCAPLPRHPGSDWNRAVSSGGLSQRGWGLPLDPCPGPPDGHPKSQIRPIPAPTPPPGGRPAISAPRLRSGAMAAWRRPPHRRDLRGCRIRRGVHGPCRNAVDASMFAGRARFYRRRPAPVVGRTRFRPSSLIASDRMMQEVGEIW